MKFSWPTKVYGMLFIAGAILLAAGFVTPGFLKPSVPEYGAVAGVNTSAEVLPNPVNSAVEQIQAKDRELAQKERQLEMQANQLERINSRKSMMLQVIFLLELALFFLLGINFYLDFKRNKKQLGYR